MQQYCIVAVVILVFVAEKQQQQHWQQQYVVEVVMARYVVEVVMARHNTLVLSHFTWVGLGLINLGKEFIQSKDCCQCQCLFRTTIIVSNNQIKNLLSGNSKMHKVKMPISFVSTSVIAMYCTDQIKCLKVYFSYCTLAIRKYVEARLSKFQKLATMSRSKSKGSTIYF